MAARGRTAIPVMDHCLPGKRFQRRPGSNIRHTRKTPLRKEAIAVGSIHLQETLGTTFIKSVLSQQYHHSRPLAMWLRHRSCTISIDWQRFWALDAKD
jgi:hypothetical protein